ncbi:trans-sialidase, putative [Trypanosoma cruzi marinkellei]|uniref:Trans-sialidase, putative n=1 Tax=Trypanosoma cruzi marinkellei TaxID=85056 RepID=K2MU92_TRYCR|nr:trans-sialidase, putative [Trypanosoma cruzi marinkellei]
MLAGNYSWTYDATEDAEPPQNQWGLLLVTGNVTVNDKKEERIYWNDTYGIPCTLFNQHHDFLTRLIGSGGSGVKTKDGTFVFPVEGTKKEGEAENDGKTKTVSLIIYSSEDTNWKLSNGTSADGCSDPSVVEWEKDKKLMMMTACDDGRRRVYESGDKGESWTEALGTLSRVWGNEHEGPEKGVGSGFITATIVGDGDDNRNVMLVTLPVYTEKREEEKKESKE